MGQSKEVDTWGLEYTPSGVTGRAQLLVVDGGGLVKHSTDAPYIMVAMPTRGTVPIEVLMAWKRIPLPINTIVTFSYLRGLLGSVSREKLTHNAIAMGAKYIYYADDDVMPPINILYKMLNELEKDPTIGLITGVYTTKQPNPAPHIYKRPNTSHYWGFSLDPMDPPEDIWGCGAGAMMVRVDAIKAAKPPYWAEEATMDNRGGTYDVTGHDLRFCQLIKEAGYRVCVDGSLLCAHIDTEGTVYHLPLNSPPIKRFNRNCNTEDYWNKVWGVETWGRPRMYAALYSAITELVPLESRVVDLGAGIGVLLQMLINHKRVYAKGYELSDTAVAYLEGRGIPAEQLNLADLELSHVHNANVILCTEVLEHLEEEVMQHALKIMGDTRALCIISVPTAEIQHPEHLRYFTIEDLQTLLGAYFNRVEVTEIEGRLLAVARRLHE